MPRLGKAFFFFLLLGCWPLAQADTGRVNSLSSSAESSFTPCSSTAGLSPLVHLQALPDPGEKLVVFPDPFYASAENRLFFIFPLGQNASLDVFNLAGDRVASLMAKPEEAKKGMLAWKGRGLDGQVLLTGTYFVHVQVDSKDFSGKFYLLNPGNENTSPQPGWVGGGKKEWSF